MSRDYIAVFWRSMPQLEAGGYETGRMIEARSLAHAERKALRRKRKDPGYASLRFLRVERAHA